MCLVSMMKLLCLMMYWVGKEMNCHQPTNISLSVLFFIFIIRTALILLSIDAQLFKATIGRTTFTIAQLANYSCSRRNDCLFYNDFWETEGKTYLSLFLQTNIPKKIILWSCPIYNYFSSFYLDPYTGWLWLKLRFQNSIILKLLVRMPDILAEQSWGNGIFFVEGKK